MKKTTVEIDKIFDKEYPEKWSAEVIIEDVNGKSYATMVDHPLGDPENPVSNNDLEDKFFNLSKKVLDIKKGKQIIEMIWNLEKLSDINVAELKSIRNFGQKSLDEFNKLRGY